MKSVDYLENIIANEILEKNIEEQKTRPQSQVLTGSMIYFTLQEQILLLLGVPSSPFDSYTLRKFQRGHDVENWLTPQMPGSLGRNGILELAKTKKAIRGVDDANQAIIHWTNPDGYLVTGHIDNMCDMQAWDGMPELQGLGILPHEIKSVTNMDFKWICKKDEAKWNHMVQIGFYAMALEIPYYMVHYVASDDYRVKSYLCQTKDIESDVRGIISEVYGQLAKGRVPAHLSRVDWQNTKSYQKYPEWSGLSEEECMTKLKEEFPAQYRKLKSFVKGGE